jgi:hypothetical protein
MMPMLCSSVRLTFIAAAILVTCSKSVFCQANPLDYVPNLPYSAQFDVTDLLPQPDGTHVQCETKVFKARDSQGRTWIKSFRSGDEDHPIMVNLYVPLRRQFIQLWPFQKTATVMTFPGTGPIPTHGLNPHGLNPKAVKTKTENLPGQTIHGIYAEGTRTTQIIPP